MAKNRAFGQIMDDADNQGFWKILKRGDSSSENMRAIPLNLIKSISDKELSAKMVLKVSWGSSWPIKISRNPIFYFMEKNGWDQFLSDNCLGNNNEFLTFRHKGNMCFSVDIYQIDGTELLRPRKSATFASPSCRNKREQRKNIYKDVKKKAIEIESSSESSNPGLKTAESTTRRRKLSLRDKKAEETEKLKRKKMKVETVCLDSEDDTLSLAPKFTITIKKSYLLFLLGIPKRFDELHMPKETTMFKIHDPEGNKSWEVKYKITGIQSRFCAGWIRLVKDLGLVIGDVCTFTLIKPNKMLVKVSK